MSEVVSAAGFDVPVTKRETDLIAVFKMSDARTVIVLFFTNSLQAQAPFRYNGLFSRLSETINPLLRSSQGLMPATPFGPWNRPPALSNGSWNHRMVKVVKKDSHDSNLTKAKTQNDGRCQQ